MPPTHSPLLALRVRGPLAVFTDPAFKVERVTVPVMTPSAARGIVEAILWKPAIRWEIRCIQVLAPIRFTSFRRNEVNGKASGPSAAVIRSGGAPPLFLADVDRAQRNTIALRDVDYVIQARFALTERAGTGDNVTKFVDMFTRRVERGQCFHAPYLGCREFAADVTSAEGAPSPIPENRPLGLMLWDIVYGTPTGNRAVFFDAVLDNGVLQVPAEPPMLRQLRASEEVA
ncbi:MAG: type I-C CRISPR-associated protein Cas5c [Gemmatimonadaceae bacterium]